MESPETLRIIYGSERYFASFRDGLDAVAKERIYIEMIEAPPLAKVAEFQGGLIAKNGPVYYALDGETVVGWCDVFPLLNPRQAHRGGLGMGLLPAYRGKGLGSRLMQATLDHARRFGLEKIELTVYTTNVAAIALYRKFGFHEEGVVAKFRKLDGVYFDCLAMAKFL